MTARSGPLRVALLQHSHGARPVYELAASLRAVEVHVSLLEGGPDPLEALLRRRGFATPLTHIPLTAWALMRDEYDVVHAFSPQDAYAGLLWRRRTHRPVVFSLTGPVEREHLSDRRLRLRLLTSALDESDAVIVHDEETRATAWRWLARELPLVDLRDGTGHERLYRRLLEGQT